MACSMFDFDINEDCRVFSCLDSRSNVYVGTQYIIDCMFSWQQCDGTVWIWVCVCQLMSNNWSSLYSG